MAKQTITLELPEELVKLLGSTDVARDKAWKALVLHLLREGEISQGKAAELLGITRYEMLGLLVKYQIPSGPLTAEEVREEIDAIRQSESVS